MLLNDCLINIDNIIFQDSVLDPDCYNDVVVKVNIVDVNDKPPIFEQDKYTAVISNDAVGTSEDYVMSVLAVDKDGTYPNNRVSEEDINLLFC